MAHPELPAEQAYVDHAYECLEQMRRQVERVGEAVDAPEYQATLFEAWARRRLETFEDADRGLCFGRLDLDGVDTSLYVGRRWVHEHDAPLVVNWQAPAARPFYTATVAQPRRAHARHRRDDPGRPVRPDHTRAEGAVRDPGRPGYREDGGRPAPGVVASLQLPA